MKYRLVTFLCGQRRIQNEGEIIADKEEIMSVNLTDLEEFFKHQISEDLYDVLVGDYVRRIRKMKSPIFLETIEDNTQNSIFMFCKRMKIHKININAYQKS